jgi:hypothetical protein
MTQKYQWWVIIAALMTTAPAGADETRSAGQCSAVKVVRACQPECDGERSLEACLQRPVSIRHADLPLCQALDSLSCAAGLHIVPDQDALDQAGVSLAQPVTLVAEDVPLKVALEKTLGQVGLTYTVRDGAIVVTTVPAARGKLVQRAYPLADLITGGRRQELRPELEQVFGELVIRHVTNTIQPASWDIAGGAGHIAYHPAAKALIVHQTPKVHEEIACMLEKWRMLQARPAPAAGRAMPPCPLAVEPRPAIVRAGMDPAMQTAPAVVRAEAVRTSPPRRAMQVSVRGGEVPELEIRCAGGDCLVCERVVLSAGSTLHLCAGEQQVQVCGEHFKAAADRLTKLDQDDRLILEGNVRLLYSKDERQAQVRADRVVLNPKTGHMEILATTSPSR